MAISPTVIDRWGAHSDGSIKPSTILSSDVVCAGSSNIILTEFAKIGLSHASNSMNVEDYN